MHVQPHRGPALEGAELYEVAELVRQPEPAAAVLCGSGSAAVGERVIEMSEVRNLTDQHAPVAPDPEGTRDAAVLDAVGRDFGEGQDQIGDRSAGEAGPGGFGRYQPAYRSEPHSGEPQRRADGRRLRMNGVERNRPNRLLGQPATGER